MPVCAHQREHVRDAQGRPGWKFAEGAAAIALLDRDADVAIAWLDREDDAAIASLDRGNDVVQGVCERPGFPIDRVSLISKAEHVFDAVARLAHRRRVIRGLGVDSRPRTSPLRRPSRTATPPP